MTDSRPAALILTPTARLARAHRRALAESLLGSGATAWRASEVQALPSWLGALGRSALLHGLSERVPITAAQARPIWQQVIDRDVFVGETRVHALCEQAWRSIHEHRLPHPASWPDLLLSEDSRRFRDWAGRFEQRCRERGLIEEWALRARLPDWISSGRLPLPSAIELIGFERPPAALVESILDALEAMGVELHGRPRPAELELPSGLELEQFDDPDAELAAAARWARQHLEADPQASVAVVVPDLAARRARVERAFLRVFDPPGFALEPATTPPWHVSLGPALAEWPLVADALLLLRFDPSAVRQADAGRVLRSPYLSAADDEGRARARTQAWLLERAPYEITAFELAAACLTSRAVVLARSLEQWQAVRRDGPRSAWPSDWVARFQIELAALGFGRGRALDSVEWQVLSRWHELLEEFAALDAVFDAPIARREAVQLLAERARGSTFRERNPGCPVEILGVEEALGSDFDALWITSLDSGRWPGAVRRDPLIPGPLQAAVPQATAEGRLEQARRDLAGLLRIGRECRLSFARGSDDAPLDPSALLPDVVIRRGLVDPPPDAAPIEQIAEDALVPVHPSTEAAGGTGVLRDQSACPFRAFARHRLGARWLAAPRPGLDARTRGNLRHWALEAFWRDLRGHQDLCALEPAELKRRIEAAVEHALGRLTTEFRRVLSPAGRRLEAASLQRLLERWLQLERNRGPFRARLLEQKIELELAGLRLSGRIDRIDETPAGTLLIDYKTGRSSRNDWKPDARIVDPQLPAYALAVAPAPAGIAFARLRPDELRFDGAAAEGLGVPGIQIVGSASKQWKVAQDWAALLAIWRENLEGLARAFRAGEAAVDPRKPEVCRTCDLQALCRIDERRAAIDNEEDAE